MFLLVSVRHVGAHPGGHQHGVSIQISINLGKTFLRISRIPNILLAWILARVFVYLPDFYFDLFLMAWHRKCVLHLSCVVHGPIYGLFMGCTVNGFLSIYIRFTFFKMLFLWNFRWQTPFKDDRAAFTDQEWIIFMQTLSLRVHKWKHFYFLWLELFSLNIEWHSFLLISLFIAAA